MASLGEKFVAVIPIQISEDCCWGPGTTVEVVEVSPHPENEFGQLSVELQADDGQIGSFAEIDLHGEYAMFRKEGGVA